MAHMAASASLALAQRAVELEQGALKRHGPFDAGPVGTSHHVAFGPIGGRPSICLPVDLMPTLRQPPERKSS